MPRICQESNHKCYWCDHNFFLTIHDQIKYYDIKEQITLRFCSDKCKSKHLEDRVEYYYEIIEKIYDNIKSFVEEKSSSDEDE